MSLGNPVTESEKGALLDHATFTLLTAVIKGLNSQESKFLLGAVNVLRAVALTETLPLLLLQTEDLCHRPSKRRSAKG